MWGGTVIHRPHVVKLVAVGAWDVELMSDGGIWLTSYYKRQPNAVHHLGCTDRLVDMAHVPGYLHKTVAKLRKDSPALRDESFKKGVA